MFKKMFASSKGEENRLACYYNDQGASQVDLELCGYMNFQKFFLRFPSHSIQEPSCATLKEKKLLLDDLKQKLDCGEVQGTTKYFVSLPEKDVHNHKL